MRRVILLLPGDMRHQRLDAHQRQAPLARTAAAPASTAAPSARTPPSPAVNPLARACRHRQVQRLTQLERLHPHRLRAKHPHIVIDHRQRLLVLAQVDPDHRPIPRHQRPQPLPPRVPPPIPPRHAATLAHQDVLSGCVWDTKPALPHQEDVPCHKRIPPNSRLPGYVLLLRTRASRYPVPFPPRLGQDVSRSPVAEYHPRQLVVGADDLEVAVLEDVVGPVDADVVDLVVAAAD